MPALFYHEFEFVWVNDGSWQSHTVEEKAISTARVAAQKAGTDVHNADILIRRVPCEDRHVNLCYHMVVSFHPGACSDHG